ncbi:diaminopimelate epimerase [bacterium]|nr:diaminopimelate epimerase [bacterium]
MKELNKIEFTKMHGTGNDFVLVEKQTLPAEINLHDLAVRVCNRKFGIGADGLLILSDHDDADFEMIFFNPDGSLAEMCGNGIRCIGKYIYDHRLSEKPKLQIQTGKGILSVYLDISDDGKVRWVEVGMCKADFTRSNIPVIGDGETALAETIVLADSMEFEFHAVSMGNPHAVIYVDDVDGFPVDTVGPMIENHELFPNRINVEFVKHISPEHIIMRIWERGAGETLSCGTGVCAAAAVSRKLGIIGTSVNITVPGGELKVRFDKDGSIILGGPAAEVFSGTIIITD